MSVKEQDLFFKILRAALWGKKLPEEIMPSDELLQSFVNHAVLGLVADVIADRVGEQQQMFIYQYMANLVRMHHIFNKNIEEIVPKLEDAGVKPVLLKGQGISVLYPMSNTRSIGDIDVFVGNEALKKAMVVVDEYCGMKDVKHEIDERCTHLNSKKGIVEFEIHYDVAWTVYRDIQEIYNRYANARLLETDEYILINGVKVPVPQTDLNAMLIFEHMLKHFRIDGVGIRQFIDWMLLIKKLNEKHPYNPANPSEIYIELKKKLKEFHLLRPWQVFGGLLVRHLGLPKEQFPFWDGKWARFSSGYSTRFIVNAENFGMGTETQKDYKNMEPSLKRKMKAFRYYWNYWILNYIIFPNDTSRRLWDQIRWSL